MSAERASDASDAGPVDSADADGVRVGGAAPDRASAFGEDAYFATIRPPDTVAGRAVADGVKPEDRTDGEAADAPVEAAPGLMRQALSLLRESVQLIVVALLLAFLIKSFAMQAFFIPSGSMLETLQIGDRVLVEKFSYRLREPERGEVIVFRRPGLADEGFSPVATWRSFLEGIGLSQPDPDRDLIKRIIGLPGETVETIGGVVHVNGLPLDEPYTTPETRDFAPVTVPEGEYYVLGDNRGNSLDSRFSLGTVPAENIVGRTFAIIWPPSTATLEVDTDYSGVGETALPPQQ
ncbi:MAG TPA: signal peptidase I [Euzebya sp.]|nr:signal peptidase I [Euzebya sp.]